MYLKTVLVTGATGFVGSRLTHELLAHTGLRVCCLARGGGDDGRAMARVVGALTERGLWDPAFAGRLEVYSGDLARPGLALSDRTWEYLARTCDLVLHNGAMVNFLFDYRAHRKTNVRGTIELLRLAQAHRPVPFHHISTLAALQDEARRRRTARRGCRPVPGRTPERATAGPSGWPNSISPRLVPRARSSPCYGSVR